MAMDFIPCWLAKQTGEHSVQVLTKVWVNKYTEHYTTGPRSFIAAGGAETRGSAFCRTSAAPGMKPFARWRYAPPTRSNLSPWLLQSLVTMGPTFTKTQWICVTRTYQSIHKITWSFHQRAHRAHRLAIPWKTQWKFPPRHEASANTRSCTRTTKGNNQRSFLCVKCLQPMMEKKKIEFRATKMFQSLIRSTRPLICIYMESVCKCVCVYIHLYMYNFKYSSECSGLMRSFESNSKSCAHFLNYLRQKIF